MNERNEGAGGACSRWREDRQDQGQAQTWGRGWRRRPENGDLEVTVRTWVFPPLGYETP